MDLLDFLTALDRPPLHDAASSPLCKWIGEAVPAVDIGDEVTVCTASYRWTVTEVYDDGFIALAPGHRDQWRRPTTVHGQHVLRVPEGPHGLVGAIRTRFDLPQPMRAVLCACGAKPRDEAAHARHAARRIAIGCQCTLGCPHELPGVVPVPLRVAT